MRFVLAVLAVSVVVAVAAVSTQEIIQVHLKDELKGTGSRSFLMPS